MNTWELGKPTKPGFYILQYSEGDRFVIVQAYIEDNNLVFENLENYSHCTDFDILHSHLEIHIPPGF